MSMLRMQRINVYALLKYCKDILEDLQRRGVVQIENVDIEDSVFYKDDTSAVQQRYNSIASTAKEARGRCAGYPESSIRYHIVSKEYRPQRG